MIGCNPQWRFPFPATDWPPQILAYIEQQNQVTVTVTDGQVSVNAVNPNDQINLFLCPSRGNRGGGINDYGYYWGSNYSWSNPDAPGAYQSILWPNSASAVSLTTLTNANGASNTAFLSHLACAPADYANGPTAWDANIGALTGNSMPDSQVPTGATLNSPWSYSPPSLSSPHPNVNPVVFADGHVQALPHAWLTQYQNQVWDWSNTTVFQFP